MPYQKESVATMGWKALKATISGVSVMKKLVPHENEGVEAPDSVFESNVVERYEDRYEDAAGSGMDHTVWLKFTSSNLNTL